MNMPLRLLCYKLSGVQPLGGWRWVCVSDAHTGQRVAFSQTYFIDVGAANDDARTHLLLCHPSARGRLE